MGPGADLGKQLVQNLTLGLPRLSQDGGGEEDEDNAHSSPPFISHLGFLELG